MSEMVRVLYHRGHQRCEGHPCSLARCVARGLVLQATELETLAAEVRTGASVLRQLAESIAAPGGCSEIPHEVRAQEQLGYALFLARKEAVRILRRGMGRALQEALCEEGNGGGV